MILSFAWRNGLHRVAVNGGPWLPFRSGGCDQLLKDLEKLKHFDLSNEEIKGWSEGKHSGGYIYLTVKGYGDIGYGHLYDGPMKLIGWKFNGAKIWWRSDLGYHACTKEEIAQWMAIQKSNEAEKFMKDLYKTKAEGKAALVV